MHPSYIVNSSTTNGDPQRMSTTFPYYNHETLNLNTSDHIQFAMEKNLSYNNGRFLSDGNDCLKNNFLKNNCLKSNCLKGKRSSNKDRHSKINTARGPRDRRMRLSVAVAKKFFRLQDLLGFDKASTTIEWLLMKSKPAIRDLGHQHLNQNRSVMLNGPCSGLECEDQSMEQSRNDQAIIPADVQERLNYCNSNCIEKRRVDQCLAKETREKARERARKRTSEKRNVIVDENTSKLGTWIPFGESQVDELVDQTEYPSSDSHLKQGFDGDNSSIMSNSWSPSFLFNYQHSLGPSHEHEFSDFQIVGKQWEGINN